MIPRSILREVGQGVCELVVTPSSYYLRSPEKEFRRIERDLLINKEFLSLYNRVKKDAIDYIKAGNVIEPNTPLFFHFERDAINQILKEELYGYKIDISAAYWETARELFLREETYLRGVENKPNRLKALGALATKRTVHVFEDGEYVRWYRERPETERLYFEVCDRVDQVMQYVVTKLYCTVGYWFDAVIIAESDPKAAARVERLFQSYGYGCKIERCKLSAKFEHGFVYLQTKTETDAKHYYTGLRVA